MPKTMNKIDFHALPKDYKGLVAMFPLQADSMIRWITTMSWKWCWPWPATN